MGLIGHWPLNGDTLDYTEYGRNGTAVGAVTNTSGKIGSCYYFDGVNDTISFGTGDTFFPIMAHTISIWFSSDGTTATTGTSPAIFGFTYGISGFLGSGGNPTYRLYRADGSSTISADNTYNYHDSKWHLYTATCDGTNMKLYIDGILKATGTAHATWNGYTSWPTNVWNIGRDNNNVHYYYRGRLNDLRLYDHALSQKEVQELAKAKILHYTFNDFQEPTTNYLSAGISGYNAFTLTNWQGAVLVDVGTSILNTPIFQYTTSGTSYVYTHDYILDDDLATLSTKTVTFSLYIKRIDVGATCRIRIYDNITSYTYSSHAITTDFQRIEMSKTIGLNPTRIFVMLDNTGSGVYEFHSPQLEIKTSATPFVDGSRTGTVRDVSGYNNDAVLNETNTPQSINDSRLGSGGYKFLSGTNQIISSDGKIQYAEDFTVCAWLKRDGLGLWVRAVDIGQGDYPGLIGIHSNNQGFFSYRLANGVDLGYMYYDINSYATQTDWFHIAVQHRRVDATTIERSAYVNGNLSSQVNVTDIKLDYNTNIYIGSTGGRDFNGSIDDVRIYQTALSVTDVLELYQTRAQLDDNGNLHLNKVNEQGYYDPALGANNLILNGDLNFGDNTNFTSTIYDATNNCFSLTTGSSTITSTEYIDYKGNGMDSWDEYSIECEVKGVDHVSKYYYMLIFYDKNKRFISHWDVAHYTNTYTTLTTALTSGDDWVYLADTTNWFDAGTDLYDHRQSLSLWLTGTDEYPAYTYSVRHQSVKDIDKPGNRILLNATYSGPTLPVGSPACNSYAGSGYSYIAAINKLTNLTDWERSVGTVSTTPNTMMRYGTKYAKIGFLVNRDAVGGTPTTLIKNLKLVNLTNPQPVSFTTNTPNLTEGGVYNTNELSEVGITDGLVGYWKLNGDAKDYSGNGNDGTVTGAVVTSGLKDLAYSFDATQFDKILMGDLPTGLTTLSVSKWLKWDGLGSTYSPFVSSRLSGVEINFQFWLGSDNILNFAYASAGVYTSKSVTTSGFLDNQFHHFIATVDGTTIKLYGDGELLATHVGIVFDPTTSGRAVIFGNDTISGGGINAGTGTLTNVKVFNRAVSPEEVMIEYKYGLPNTGMQLAKNGTLFLNGEINEGL